MLTSKTKTDWTTALRSGKYIQGIQYLKQSHTSYDAYCCLGVLCEINNIPSIGSDIKSFVFENKYSSLSLPGTFQMKMGLTNEQCNRLASMNDDQKKSFAEIADYIEENL